MKELTEKEKKKKIREKELAIIKASNEMLEQAKKTVVECSGKDELSISEIMNDIDAAKRENDEMGEKYYNATPDEIKNTKYGKVSKSEVKKYQERLLKKGITDEEMRRKDMPGTTTEPSVAKSVQKSDFDEEDMYEFEKAGYVGHVSNRRDVKPKYVENKSFNVGDIPANVQYDIIPLPSKGQCYSHKKSRIPVGYLTASDENLITSPNLYRDGKVIDLILQRKILDNTINPDDLCKGDRDAILLWLRATGYGSEFPVTVHDPELDIDYDVTVNLDDIEMKEFDLVGDENGWFDYTTKNGDKIKFCYLSRNDEMVVKDTLSTIASNARREKIIQEAQDLMKEVKNDELLQQKDKTKLQNACAGLYKWGKTLTVLGGGETFGNQMTLTMALSIKSINGITDREFINQYVENMRAHEAYDFRNYMTEHTPGMDFRIVVTRPESDGGGSFETFLELDSLLFLRLPKVRGKS